MSMISYLKVLNKINMVILSHCFLFGEEKKVASEIVYSVFQLRRFLWFVTNSNKKCVSSKR